MKPLNPVLLAIIYSGMGCDLADPALRAAVFRAKSALWFAGPEVRRRLYLKANLNRIYGKHAATEPRHYDVDAALRIVRTHIEQLKRNPQ